MNFATYCSKNGLSPFTQKAKKMYAFYKEASEASTDMKKEPMTGFVLQTAYHKSDFITDCIQLAPLNCPQVCNPVPCQAKGNKPMYVDNDKHIESSKINYLTDRASNVYYTKESGLSKTFGFELDKSPETPAELVKRIQDGKFILRKETEDKATYDPARYITWKDPSVKEDKEGLKLARMELESNYQNVKDVVALSTHAEALAAIKTLEAWTPTVGNA